VSVVTAGSVTGTGRTQVVLEVQDLTVRFGGVVAVSGVSFDVHQGELLAVIGPNGAGKTSLFNCVNGVYRPTSGDILLDGESLVGRSPARIAKLGVARTFQNLALFANLDVVTNVMLGRHGAMRTGFVAGALWWGRARREEIEHRARCEEIIDLLDLTPFRKTPVSILPYGVQKRVELARALAMEPRLLLLDEPVAGMNLEETEDMARYIVELRRGFDLTIMLVEHHMHMVMDLADRLVVLDFGKRIAVGAPDAVADDPKVIEAYLGEPA
jgi:branched-chain amino acid transport system ATP-binding protein